MRERRNDLRFMNIDDLKKEVDSRKSHISSDDVSIGPKITSQEKHEALEEKMGEIKRREIEQQTLLRSRSLGVGYVNLSGIAIDTDTLKLASEEESMSAQAIVFYFESHRELRIGSPDPKSPRVIEFAKKLGEKLGIEPKIYVISPDSFREAMKQYKRLPHITELGDTVEVTPDDLSRFGDIESITSLARFLRNGTATEMVNAIVAGALKFNASDIHLETEQNRYVIRYRLDGVLHEAASVDPSLYKPIMSRIKLLSGLKINISNKPQDGHFVISMPDGRVDVRVSTLPTNYGESIVMRILRSDMGNLRISELGLSDYYKPLIEREIKRPNGMIVVCGPTGSGKTTTLYSMLGQLNTPENKILTVEDPIEYRVSGISQSQVDSSKGYTFSVALRSLVRQDPDVILVGEMRDTETIEISINAALTGHLVLTTLHTNDAAGAIPRFLAMGAKPYLLAPSLNTVIGQRLVRVLCEFCKIESQIPDEHASEVRTLIETLPDEAKKYLPDSGKYYTAKGCSECHGLGFKGRIGIFEIFTMSPDLEKLILSSEMSESVMREKLREQGMITMAQDGIIKALNGITTVKEVFRVVDDRR